jgi:hypothetical protein
MAGIVVFAGAAVAVDDTLRPRGATDQPGVQRPASAAANGSSGLAGDEPSRRAPMRDELPVPEAAKASTPSGTTSRALALTPGDHGPAVRVLQERLTALGYWLASSDGTYGRLTQDAVMAFQKHEGLPVDGVAGRVTRQRVAKATPPKPRAIADQGIEIDLERQLLLVVRGGETQWVLHTSTGAPPTPTPTGVYAVEREIDGMRHAPLGALYRPKYFNAGIAFHGSTSVPPQPASHGCARLRNAAMDMLWSTGLASVGTTVSVY